jgi:(p)ppGpp synthase/HD superfamily hydrolase
MTTQNSVSITPDQAVLIERAAELVLDHHRTQRDKAGMPYVLHPFAVAVQLQCPLDIMAALLHDTIEDTAMTAEVLRDEGFPPVVIECVIALTRVEGETYEEFILRCKQNPMARRVKLADLRHNLDLGRRSSLTETLKERYLRAVQELTTDKS